MSMFYSLITLILLVSAAASSAAETNTPTPLITRASVQKFTPMAYAALLLVDAERGEPVQDEELPQLLQSDAFASKVEQVRQELCSTPAHQKHLMCMGQAPAHRATTRFK